MGESNLTFPPSIDPRSGFCAKTKTFHSLRPAVQIPPPSLPLSFPSFAFSLLPSPLPSYPAFIDSSTGSSISYPELLSQVRSLAASLQSIVKISKGDVAFVLSPTRLHLPVLYLSLLSLGAVISPANPASTPDEISRLILLSKPSFAFATSATSRKLPTNLTTILLDSPEFERYFKIDVGTQNEASVEIQQSDLAVISYSSGTTGLVKAVGEAHRKLIAIVAQLHGLGGSKQSGRAVILVGAPSFHTMGFTMLINGFALSETIVLMTGERAGVMEILAAAERYRATMILMAPPVAAAMAHGMEAARYDLGALEIVLCGGAALSTAVAERFRERFPWVVLAQGYGSTEGGAIASMHGPYECSRLKSVGRLSGIVEAKIVDPTNGESLPVDQVGELYIRGPVVMTGYVGDEKASAGAFDSDGWLKTGDLCFFDEDGFLYIVDRLKEIIKYKAYQVAPAELEELLVSIPGIVDAAVVPYPDEQAGEIPMAFLVKQPGSTLTEVEVMDQVAKKVAPYKKIRKVAFVDSILRSPAGKILRRVLADRAASNFRSRL